MKIYIVMARGYENYSIVAAFEKKEDAEKFEKQCEEFEKLEYETKQARHHPTLKYVGHEHYSEDSFSIKEIELHPKLLS
jgi:hypothetical protein